METINSLQDAIQQELNKIAAKDALFAENYKKPNKSIEECCKYVMQEVEKEYVKKNGRKNGGCHANPDWVIGLAIHYYDEDGIKVEGPESKVAVQTEEPKKEENKAEEVKKEEPKPKKGGKKAKSEPKPQPEPEVEVEEEAEEEENDELEIPLF